MSLVRQRPRLVINSHGPKHRGLDQSEKDLALSGGCLTPEPQTHHSHPLTTPKQGQHCQCRIYKIGKYVLEHVEGDTYKACDSISKEEKICKVCLKLSFFTRFIFISVFSNFGNKQKHNSMFSFICTKQLE